MIALLILAANAPTAIDAERAFAADAQAKGQWTAFRAWAADDAVMFVPQPTNAQAWLKGRADPKRSVKWWPTASYVSCDGRIAVNTGGWTRSDGTFGYFSTVWTVANDGRWKWVMDHGDELSIPRKKPNHPKVVRAKCSGRAHIDRGGLVISGSGNDDFYVARDETLNAGYFVRPTGERSFFTVIWTGHNYKTVINDVVAAPQ